jgi:uncharacterized membrane protein
MNPWLEKALLLVHILSMAVWIAGSLSLPGDIRKTLARGKPHTEMLAGRMNRSLSIVTIAALFTIGTGFAMFFMMGGFKTMPHRYHAAIALAIIALGLLSFGIRPAASQIERALAAGEGNDLRALSGRIGMLTGIDHLLKLVIMVLMVFPLELL